MKKNTTSPDQYGRPQFPILSRFGVTPPSRNGLSHANKERNADFAEKLLWSSEFKVQSSNSKEELRQCEALFLKSES